MKLKKITLPGWIVSSQIQCDMWPKIHARGNSFYMEPPPTTITSKSISNTYLLVSFRFQPQQGMHLRSSLNL